MSTQHLASALATKPPGVASVGSAASLLTRYAPKPHAVASVASVSAPKPPSIPIPKQKISIAPPPTPVAAPSTQVPLELAPVDDDMPAIMGEGTVPVSASPSLPKTLPTNQNGVSGKASSKASEKAKDPKKRPKEEEEDEEEDEEESGSSDEESGSDEEDGDDEEEGSSSSEESSEEEEEEKSKKKPVKKEEPKKKEKEEKKPSKKEEPKKDKKKEEKEEKPKKKKEKEGEEKKKEGEEKKKASSSKKSKVSEEPPQRYPFTIEKTPPTNPDTSRKVMADRPKVTDEQHAGFEKYENVHHSYYADMEAAGYKMVHCMCMQPDSLKRRAEAFAEAEKLESDKSKQRSSSADGVPASKKNDSQVAVTAYVKKLSNTRWLDFDVWLHEGRNQAVIASDFRVKEHVEQNPQLDSPQAYRKVRFILGRVLSRAACGVPQKPAGRVGNKSNVVYKTSTVFTQKSFSPDSGSSPTDRKWVPDILYNREQIAHEEAAMAEDVEEEEEAPPAKSSKKSSKKNKEEDEVINNHLADVEQKHSKKAKVTTAPPPAAVMEEPKAVQVPVAVVTAPAQPQLQSVVPIFSTAPDLIPLLRQLLDNQAIIMNQNSATLAQNEAIKALFAQLYARKVFSGDQ